MDLQNFELVHGILLASAGVPPNLVRQLHSKLTNDIYDGGNCFEIEPCEDGLQRRLVLTCDKLEKESQVFLVDHAWSFRLTEARKQVFVLHSEFSVPNFVRSCFKSCCLRFCFGNKTCFPPFFDNVRVAVFSSSVVRPSYFTTVQCHK